VQDSDLVGGAASKAVLNREIKNLKKIFKKILF
jgi:hypothetical protein